MSFFSKLFGKKSDNTAAPVQDVTPQQPSTDYSAPSVEPSQPPAVPSEPAMPSSDTEGSTAPEVNETPDQTPPAPSV